MKMLSCLLSTVVLTLLCAKPVAYRVTNDNFGFDPWVDPFHPHRQLNASHALRSASLAPTCSWPNPSDKCKCNGTAVELESTLEPTIFVADGTGKWAADFVAAYNFSSLNIGAAGPVTLFIADKNSDAASLEDLAKGFCWTLYRANDTSVCDEGKGTLVKGATSGRSSAVTTVRAYNEYGGHCDNGHRPITNLYTEEVVVTVVNQFDNNFTALHEYTHVFHNHFLPFMQPRWLLSGSADYHAYTLGAKYYPGPNALNFTRAMVSSLYDIQRMHKSWLGGSKLVLKDCEVEYTHLPQWYYPLCYSSGAWATAYMIHLSKKPPSMFWSEFFPSVVTLGSWQDAIAAWSGMSDIDSFYAAFDKFIRSDNFEALVSILEGQDE